MPHPKIRIALDVSSDTIVMTLDELPDEEFTLSREELRTLSEAISRVSACFPPPKAPQQLTHR